MRPESSIKVLLVDDHAVVRNGVRLMLGTATDIEVAAEAERARDALSLVQVQIQPICDRRDGPLSFCKSPGQCQYRDIPCGREAV